MTRKTTPPKATRRPRPTTAPALPDISQGEKKLPQEVRFLQAVFDGIQDGISVLDNDLTIVRVNHAIEAWYPQAMPLVGQKCYAAYHQRSAPCQTCPVIKALKGGRRQIEEVSLTGPRRVEGWLELYAFPMYDEAGNITGAIEYVRNITQRQRAEAARRESEERLKSVIDNIPQAIFWKNRQLVYLGCNRQFAEDGGLSSPDEIVGKTALDMPWANHAAFYHSDDMVVIESDQPKLNIEEPLTRADGTQRWLRTNKLPMHDAEGRVTGVITTYEDITERKKMEQYVLHTERLAAMGRLAAALAHEINNPLHAIGNGLELVLDFSLEAGEQRQYLEAALREIERLQALARRVLEFARPPQLARQPTDVGDVIRHALTLCSKQLQHSRIEVALNLPTGLPEVFASRDHLTQVFLNLIINAIEAMPQGGTLCISADRFEDRLELSFGDTGTGIPPELLAMVFEPFYTTKQDGTGLGLAVSHNIIQEHGGNITAKNTPEGAMFILTLPIAEASGPLPPSEADA
jgi:two-component system, cell cycle sensor histidine kinase and response regulator CckA